MPKDAAVAVFASLQFHIIEEMRVQSLQRPAELSSFDPVLVGWVVVQASEYRDRITTRSPGFVGVVIGRYNAEGNRPIAAITKLRCNAQVIRQG